MITAAEKAMFEGNGYLIVKGVFGAEEVEMLRDHFMRMHANGPIPGHFEPATEEEANGDILKMYPRIMHPHVYDDVSMKYMLDSRVHVVLKQLFGEEAMAAQSMLYFKPPGAKGQALHQDNFYLRVEPGTCIAAWTALDRSDEENGGLFIVPGSQNSDILCPHTADPNVSFSRDEVDVPEGLTPVAAILEPGDVMFFNGSVIHGSYPNMSKDRFRRSFICHYVGESTTKIHHWYSRTWYEDGTTVKLEQTDWGGPCGTEFDNLESVH
ncbi:phytanoyl-CoA dioxygenase family protein [Paenibacillus sp. LHD-117]|uniref:phytanoyl-CoA dioxygenase family protein n=1 Tax=Paenibacillus sp. LHD-117 TaxID=3071412 RepID=UPI0027DF0B26|nr:phytanoyl-CoA dioxygenase family protein [Paenibacillus sp. LHD-117]MDQ6423641.1 phytanoyl-CoA dioxygenase family protein [Paenibacillus sp. LHD-117]